MKIGNLSDIDYTNDSEQIDQLSAYRSWRNILSTVIENKNTLVGNINAYNQMKTIRIENEIKKTVLSNADKKDIESAWSHSKNSQTGFTLSILALISTTYYLTHISIPPFFGLSLLFIILTSIILLGDKIESFYKKIFWSHFGSTSSLEFSSSNHPIYQKTIKHTSNYPKDNLIIEETEKFRNRLVSNILDSDETPNSSFSKIANDLYEMRIYSQHSNIYISDIIENPKKNYYCLIDIYIIATLKIREEKQNELFFYLDNTKIHFRTIQGKKYLYFFKKAINRIKKNNSILDGKYLCRDEKNEIEKTLHTDISKWFYKKLNNFKIQND